ncbi:MAG: metallophosphoesterase family protein [Polyangiaceae bacterium]|jgi:hypothetical protein
MVRLPRTVIVGDLHGCAAELEDLLSNVGFQPRADRLVLVGDVVARGPDSHRAVALARRLGATWIRGNHEQKLIAAHRRGKSLGPDHRKFARELSPDDWQLIESTPLWLDLPDHGVRVVHAGVVPGLAFTRTPPDAIMRVRTCPKPGHWSRASDGGPLWGSRYVGPPHIVFGHNARPEPQVWPWATGIDTGCVYGGRLTAVVLAEGETIRRGEGVRGSLVSVRARKRYYEGGPTAKT